MMNSILLQENLAPNIKKLVVLAPLVAEKVRPGEFVVLIIDEKGDRIPLTVADSDKAKGTITLIFQEVGKTTYNLGRLKAGEQIANLLGPLGRAQNFRKLGTAVAVGGGVGIAEVYPIIRALKAAGNKVISILGARSKDLLILEQPLRRLSNELFVTTDDGSYGRKGFVSDVLQEILKGTKVDLIYAVGPVPMMRRVCELSRPYGIKTLVSLNPIMLDATGMCGACRVSVQGETKFACVDGPEFDGHLVDFTELERRLQLFSEKEKKAIALERGKG